MGRDRRSSGRLAALIILAVLSLSARADAQSAGDKAAARSHYDRAEAFRQAGAFDKAIEEYQAAYQLVPKAGFLFNIGLAYQELGDRARAVEFYGKYLATGPKGDTADEAVARKTQLERELAAAREAEAQAAAAKAAAEQKQRAIDDQRALAAREAKAGNHAAAIAAYRAAHEASRDAELLFDLAEVMRASGDKKQALATFERYRAEAPGGPRAGDAIERIAALEREIAAGAGGGGSTSGGLELDGNPVVEAGPRGKPTSGGKNRLLWFSLATAAIGAGLFLDLAPELAKNGHLDGFDFVPAGLYALGSTFVLVGIF